MQRLCLVGFFCYRAQSFCHPACNQWDGLASVKMLVIEDVGPGFIPGPMEMGVTGGVNRARVTGEDL